MEITLFFLVSIVLTLYLLYNKKVCEVNDMIKLLVSDIDGTLLNEKHVVDSPTQIAVKKLRESGISFMVASGRNYEAILEALQVFDFKCKCIALNGADFRDNDGKSLIIKPIGDAAIDKMKMIIENSEVTMEYYCADGAYTQIDQDQLIPTYIENFMYMFDISYAKAKKFIDELAVDKYMITLKDFDEIRKHTILKLEFHFRDKMERNRVKELLYQIEGLHVTSSAPLNIEVTHYDATKGNMIEAVCEYYGYAKEEVVVIGDSANDLSMLTRFPHSYAMGNASDYVKDAATHITDDNAHQGVAKVIHSLLENQ